MERRLTAVKHTHTNTHTCSVLLKPQKREKGDEERKRKEVDKRKMTKSSTKKEKWSKAEQRKSEGMTVSRFRMGRNNLGWTL